MSTADALVSLNTSEQGLQEAEAERRLKEFGPNRIDPVQEQHLLIRLLSEFSHFFAIILWIAAGLALFSEWQNPGEGMLQLAAAIVSIILINGFFSFWQEFRAEQAVAALTRLLPHQAKVVRNGKIQEVGTELLVPGDMLLLEEGDNVPADCRLIRDAGIRVNTSTVTGESLPKSRSSDATSDANILEAKNLLLAGTPLVSGHGTAVVFATGARTEFGRIAHLTQTTVQSASHLQLEIARLSKLIAIFASALGIVFFLIGYLMGLPFWVSLMFGIGIIVANVPEGLLPTVTLSLAMATQRMAHRNALVRHLPAVETLGSTTVICTDKTGTLTQNIMSVSRLFIGNKFIEPDDLAVLASSMHLLKNAKNCHNLKFERNGQKDVLLGDPMELAFFRFASGIRDFGDAARLKEIPFDSERRRMSVIVEQDGERWLYCKGAPETVLPLCDRIERGDTFAPFDAIAQQQVIQAQKKMAEDGLRVLAFAWRKLDGTERLENLQSESALTLSGLIGLHDPPWPQAEQAIAKCRSAGIKVIMLTGDHPQTAIAIARQIGLVRSEHPVVVLGESLRKMTMAQLQFILDSPEVLFTRVTAEQKMLVVQALKNKRHIVAVTGDGVNDAPALKSAHIGIAMGSGTDVAKETADIILLDDNFASIVSAIEEGRAVFENIRKFLTYILSSNIPELIPYLAFVLFKIPLPLTILQILAVDLGTDMVPALALGAEPPDAKLMQQPPRPSEERLLSWPLLARAYLWLGMLEAAAAMTTFFVVLYQEGWTYGSPLGSTESLYLQATTACFAAIVAAQAVNLFSCRHPHESAFAFPLLRNRLLLIGLAVEFVLLLLIVYTPFGNTLFGTYPLDAADWIPMVFLALGCGLLEELRKRVQAKLLANHPYA